MSNLEVEAVFADENLLPGVVTHTQSTDPHISGGGVRAEDGGVMSKQGLITRPGPATDEHERMSVWWANVDVVKTHLRYMLNGRDTLVSRNTFKRAETVARVHECFNKRFAAHKPPPPANDGPPASDSSARPKEPGAAGAGGVSDEI